MERDRALRVDDGSAVDDLGGFRCSSPYRLDPDVRYQAIVGSLNADLVIAVRRFPGPGETVTGHDFAVFPGGKGANQAYSNNQGLISRKAWS